MEGSESDLQVSISDSGWSLPISSVDAPTSRWYKNTVNKYDALDNTLIQKDARRIHLVKSDQISYTFVARKQDSRPRL